MEEKKQGWITEGLILASIPVLGYFFAFNMRQGMRLIFNILKLILVGLPQIILATITLWTGLIILFMLVESITMMLRRRSEPIRQHY